MRKGNLYIVQCADGDGIDIGHLPFSCIPKDSIIWECLQTGEQVINTADSAVIGYYNNKKLAKEHLRIEKKWREGSKFNLITMKHDANQKETAEVEGC